jgi:basic amino acid/polyamine antiporter, APA family
MASRSATSIQTTDGVRPAPRAIGFWMAVALVMGNMIGSGIFLLPASLAPYGGLSLVGWLATTAGSLMLALVFARLARLDPAAGGPYAYTRRAFGDLPAFLVAWGYWISMWTSLGALAVALVGYLTPFAPALAQMPAVAAVTAVAVVWLLVGVNVAGVHTAGWVQVVTTVLKILPLAAISAAGLASFEPSHFALPQEDTRSLLTSVPAVATLTLWAFLGLESATVPSDSIENPDRTIPRATIVGTLLTAIIYVVSTVGVMSLLPPSALGQSTAPFADAARAVAGNWAAAAVAIGAAISCFGALNGWVLLVGQLPLAVARDGLFPQVFARVSSRGTPAAGMVIAAVLTTALVSLNYTRDLVALFTFFILLSTLNTLIPYVFSSLAVFLIRDSPRHLRLSAGAAVAAALAFLYSVWAIGGAGQETVYWGFILILCGLPVYVAVVRRSPDRPGSS